jgi:hypothetical protein
LHANAGESEGVMKTTTRDRTRVYAQSTRSYARSRFAWLVRVAVGRKTVLGEVDAWAVRFSHAGRPRRAK